MLLLRKLIIIKGDNMKNRVVIIGCGNVGMSYAYALLNQKTKVNELILIDIDKNRIQGEAADLNHGLAFAPSKIDIRVGDYEDCRDATIVCICAGANQSKGETRLDLVHKNNAIFKTIIENIVASGFLGIYLIATNPVDVMTYITYKYSKSDPSRVIGTGTTLDTARLRYLISDKLDINAKNIHAYIMGEHGDSEFPLWSNAYVGSVNVHEYIDIEELNKIAYNVKNAAYDIINKKGATYYGIGMVLVRITNAILDDENTIFTVSSYNKEYDLFIGYPVVVGRKGVVGNIKIKLTEIESDAFNNSIKVIKDVINTIE
jgi:L-lactate dehydrogenase